MRSLFLLKPPLLPLLQAKILFHFPRLEKTAKNFSDDASSRCLSGFLQLLEQRSTHKSTLSSLASSWCIFPKLFLGSDSLFCLPRSVDFPSVSIASLCRFLLSFSIASCNAGITSAVSEEQRVNGTSHWSLSAVFFPTSTVLPQQNPHLADRSYFVIKTAFCA